MNLTSLLIAFLLICIYGFIRCKLGMKTDVLATSFHVWDLDLWSVTHFCLFFITARQNPGFKEGVILFMLGGDWELFEHILGKKRPAWLGGCPFSSTEDGEEGRAWWYGRTSDIVVNSLGIIAANLT